MKERVARLAGITAIAALAGLGWHTAALAQQQTTITKMSGSASSGGTWTRTITDISEPNGPGGGTIQTTYPVIVTYSMGDNAATIAAAYRTACMTVLPVPPLNPNGYGAVPENTVTPSVRLSKQAGTYSFSDGGLPPGVTFHTLVPSNAEHAPLASPAGLASLIGGLSALAWWARRRRITV